MAIDTANKRKSVINFSVPGAYLLPIPDGSITAVNRRQMTDSYALEPVNVPRSLWVQDSRGTNTWVQDSDLSNTWVQDSDAASTDWVQDQEMPQ